MVTWWSSGCWKWRSSGCSWYYKNEMKIPDVMQIKDHANLTLTYYCDVVDTKATLTGEHHLTSKPWWSSDD